MYRSSIDSSIKNDIKSIAALSDSTLLEIIEKINKKFGKKIGSSTFSRKLSLQSLKLSEAKMIAEVLDLQIVWMPKIPQE